MRKLNKDKKIAALKPFCIVFLIEIKKSLQKHITL